MPNLKPNLKANTGHTYLKLNTLNLKGQNRGTQCFGTFQCSSRTSTDFLSSTRLRRGTGTTPPNGTRVPGVNTGYLEKFACIPGYRYPERFSVFESLLDPDFQAHTRQTWYGVHGPAVLRLEIKALGSLPPKHPYLDTMLAKTLASLAVIGSAAAYVPMMSMDMGRREVVQAGAAAAAVTPFLSGASVNAAMDKSAKAPQITIFDHRGCSRAPKESTGAKAGGQDDEMMVKVASTKVSVSEADAAKALQEFITFEKGIDGPFTSKN
eukprot:1701074-Rhodomonas_salina.2